MSARKFAGVNWKYARLMKSWMAEDKLVPRWWQIYRHDGELERVFARKCSEGMCELFSATRRMIKVLSAQAARAEYYHSALCLNLAASRRVENEYMCTVLRRKRA